MSGERGPARDAPSAPLEKAGTRRAPTAALLGPLPRRPPLHRLASLCPRKPVSQPGPFGPNARPPPRLSRVKAGARARQLRGLLHLPASSRGSPRRRLPRASASTPSSAFPMRMVLGSRAALAPAPPARGRVLLPSPGQPRRRRSVPLRPPWQPGRRRPGPRGAGRGTCTSSQGELGVRTTKAPCLSPGTGRSHRQARQLRGRPPLRETQRTTGPQPFAPRPAPGSSDVHSPTVNHRPLPTTPTAARMENDDCHQSARSRPIPCLGACPKPQGCPWDLAASPTDPHLWPGRKAHPILAAAARGPVPTARAAPTLARRSGRGWRGASGRRTWTTRPPCATRRRRS